MGTRDSEKESVKGDYGEERNESYAAVYIRLLRTPAKSKEGSLGLNGEQPNGKSSSALEVSLGPLR